MKVQLERDEIQRVLCGYVTHTLGIKTNRMDLDGAHRAFLSYDPEQNGDVKPSLWRRITAWGRQ